MTINNLMLLMPDWINQCRKHAGVCVLLAVDLKEL